jgi:uncharacterized membrane protein YhhN
MYFSLLGIALFIAMIDWFAVAKDLTGLRYFSKPGVMIALLVWIALTSGFTNPMSWFALAIFFSLGGDVFLLLPEKVFIAGLISFLFAHIAYIIGLNQTLPPFNLVTLILLSIIAMTAAGLYWRIASGLSSGRNNKLRLPVLIYVIVISLMVFSALVTLARPDSQWKPYPALLVSAGALLFFISDASLAWDRFVEKLPYGSLQVITTYHLGQISIILGTLLQFTK